MSQTTAAGEDLLLEMSDPEILEVIGQPPFSRSAAAEALIAHTRARAGQSPSDAAVHRVLNTLVKFEVIAGFQAA